MRNSIERLELHLLATMTAMLTEDPNAVTRINRVYQQFMGTVSRPPTSEIMVDPEDMAEWVFQETDEFGGKDYTIPESQMRKLRLA